jgi:histone-arginine methyltransferase CARM1
VAKAAFWQSTDYYGLDISCLAEAAMRDHFAQPVVGLVDPASLLSTERATRVIDFSRDTPESLHLMELPLDFAVDKTGLCHGLALWFDVLFDGSAVKAVLSTAPTEPATHWYQCRLLLREPLAVNARQRITGTLRMEANTRYSYNLTLTMAIGGSAAATSDGEPIASTVHVALEQQLYNYR